MAEHLELLSRLLEAKKPSEVDAILLSIGDHPDLSVDTPFGASGFIWRFYGNTDSNLSTIHLGSKPGRSLTERITNAIDAVLEERMARGSVVPTTPMEAAKLWFGRPPTTSDNGLFKWKDYHANEFDQLVQVVIHPGDDESTLTVDVLDAGIGIRPNEFGQTIVSLQRGNKMRKPYLVGAYGQGGSATIRYSKYTLIVSRHMDDPAVAGFTLVRRMRLPDPYKVDAYVYLSLKAQNGEICVPSCAVNPDLDFYAPVPNHGIKSWTRGTLVRHYGYELKGLENPLQASPGNLYHEFQCLMFDPLLPFRLIDLRTPKTPGKYRNEVIRGSRNRLMNYTLKDAQEDDGAAADEDGTAGSVASPKSVLRHHAPRQLVSLRSDSNPCVGIEYWVVMSERKSGEKIILRPSSELFVDRGHPILGTLHGQNQGDRTDLLLRDLDLPTVSKHIVIHIDASGADRDTRLGLFVSTREGFSEGNEFKELIRLLAEILRDDEELYAIENELVERIISKETASTDAEVKKEIAALLRDAGLQLTQPGEATSSGQGDQIAPPKKAKPKPPSPPQPPLPTLPYPTATQLTIVYPAGQFRIPLNERHAVGVETDADARYDREGRLAIRADPPFLEVASKGELHGGRIRWRLRPTEGSKPGDAGEVIVSLTRPDGSQLKATLPFEVLSPRIVMGKDSKGLLPDFEILPIDPYTESDLLEQLWPRVSKDDIPGLAYKPFPVGQKIIVYYSTAFGPYRAEFAALANHATLAQLFEHEYKIWIGYHAILQHMSRQEPALDPEPEVEERTVLERYLGQIQDQAQDRERALVAEMQVKQALKSAELKNKTLKATAS